MIASAARGGCGLERWEHDDPQQQDLPQFWRHSTRWGRSGRLYQNEEILIYATGAAMPPSSNGVVRLYPWSTRGTSSGGPMNSQHAEPELLQWRRDTPATACSTSGVARGTVHVHWLECIIDDLPCDHR